MTVNLIGQLQAAAAPGQQHLDGATIRRLRELTGLLIAARPGADGELARFLAIGSRELPVPEADLSGMVVLVTGGTGCIGTALTGLLAARHPGCLVSVSRGVTNACPPHPDVKYRYADVRNRAAMDRLMLEYQPGLVFHVAAQREPGLAEVQVHRTVSTNVLGTRNVLAAAADAGVPQVVLASTGKALRPYSPDIYTASKRAAEWVAAGAARSSGMLVSAARFTHVMDNSVIFRRLRSWADGGEVIRLHSPDIGFYVQSARESAQLLLLACRGSERGELRVHAISDLGWPAALLDLALGILAESGSASPVYFSGYHRGYEEIPFPALYDPVSAGGISPLLSIFEAAAVTSSPCPEIDAFRLDMADGPQDDNLLAALDGTCDRTQDPDTVRSALDELSWSLYDATLRAAPRDVVRRAAVLALQHPDPHYRRVLAVLADHAGS